MVLMNASSLPATTTGGTTDILTSTSFGSTTDESTLQAFTTTFSCTVDSMFMTHMEVGISMSGLPCATTDWTNLYYLMLPSQNTRLSLQPHFFLVGWSASEDVQEAPLGQVVQLTV